MIRTYKTLDEFTGFSGLEIGKFYTVHSIIDENTCHDFNVIWEIIAKEGVDVVARSCFKDSGDFDELAIYR